MNYDDHQEHPWPCVCGRMVSNTDQCAKWKAERDGVTCPYRVLHQATGKVSVEAAA